MCKNPIRKGGPHGDRKDHKGTDNYKSKGVIQSELFFATFAISVCKNPIRKGDPHGDPKDHKGTDNYKSKAVIQSELFFATFAISVCKNPIRKGDPHGDRKDHKGTDNYKSKGSSQSELSLRPLRSLCVKIRSEKAIHTEIPKIAKERTNDKPKAVIQSELVFATFAISVCKNPIGKGDPHGDRKGHKGAETTNRRGSSNPNWSLRPLRSLCVKIRSEKAIHTEIAKITKEQTTTNQGVINPKWSLRPLRSLCVKVRSEKAIHTEIAKIAKERTTTNQRGHPIRIVLCDLCDLCV